MILVPKNTRHIITDLKSSLKIKYYSRTQKIFGGFDINTNIFFYPEKKSKKQDLSFFFTNIGIPS